VRARSTPFASALATIGLSAAAACGGAASAPSSVPSPAPTPAAAACPPATALAGDRCVAYAERLTERIPTPFVENGRAVTLEVVTYRPLAPGPHPLALVHHGSTGTGSDPALFAQTFTSETVARFFVDRGWMAAFPQRRGRGTSDGLYDEGFNATRTAYSCVQSVALTGVDRALADLDAVVAWARGRRDAIPSRLVNAGVSRGGVLAVTHAAERPGVFHGAVNFVGGWLGEGCSEGPATNRTLFTRAGRFDGETIWIYGENDSFYSMAHSRSNFDAFRAAGGRGSFHAYARAAGLNGHFITNDPQSWTPVLDAFLRSLGP
jgi:dienelactone hydrolase